MTASIRFITIMLVTIGPTISVCHAQTFAVERLTTAWSSWKPYDSSAMNPITGAVIDTVTALRGALNSARFLSPDRLWESYRAWSPYQYGLNNPMRYTDPSGDSVVFQGGPEGELERHFNTSVNSLSASGVDVSRIRRLQNDPDVHVTLQWSDQLDGNGFSPTYVGGTVFWNPNAAMQFVDDQTPAMPGDVSGKMSPAQILHHELGGHGYEWKYNEQQTDRAYRRADPQYGRESERWVIENVEQPASRILGQAERHCHCGNGYPVASPISTTRLP